MENLVSRFGIVFKLVFLAVLVFSCTLEEPLPFFSDEIPSGALVEKISLDVDEPESLTSGTKSSYTNEDLKRISSMNIFVYYEGKLLKEYSRFFSDAKDIYMTFPPDKDGFDVYMLGNTGQVVPPENEEDLVDLQYVVDDYEEFRTKGFPVANSFIGYVKGSQTRFVVKRLVGQYSLSFENVSEIAEYTVRDLTFYNCARDVYPFGNGQPATMFFCDGDVALPGDHLSAEDVETINAGGSVDLYFLENLQGVLLPTNTDPKLKVPDSVGESAKKCTYIRATVDIRTPAGQYTNGAYRFYCGSDATSDFNIRRNTRYTAKLNFNQDMVNEEKWRIEVDEPEEIGEFIFDKPYATVIYGVEDMVYITPVSGNHADLEYYIEYDPSSEVSSDYIQYELVDTYQYLNHEKVLCKGIHITSLLKVDGNGTYKLDDDLTKDGFKIARLLVKSVDSYNHETIKVSPLEIRVYNKRFPIKVTCNSKATIVNMQMNNPLNLSFDVYTTNRKTMERDHTMHYHNCLYRVRGKYYTLSELMGLEWTGDFVYGSMVSSKNNSLFSIGNSPTIKNVDLTIKPVYDKNVSYYFGMDELNTKIIEEVVLLYPKFVNGAKLLEPGPNNIDAYFSPFNIYTLGKSKTMYGDKTIFPDGVIASAENQTVSVRRYVNGNPNMGFQLEINAYANNYGREYNYFTPSSYKYGIAPFDIVNCSFRIENLIIYNNDPTSLTGSNHQKERGFDMYATAPGSDMYDGTSRIYHCYYKTENIYQAFGNIHRWYSGHGYNYSDYFLTVNGMMVF